MVVNSIAELTATKDGVDPLGLITTKRTDPNIFVYGTKTNMVVIATRLPAPFFAGAGVVRLSGTAKIVTGGRRRLSSTRDLQETTASDAATEEESSGFVTEVDVVVASDASGGLAIKTTTAVVVFSAFAAGFFV